MDRPGVSAVKGKAVRMWLEVPGEEESTKTTSPSVHIHIPRVKDSEPDIDLLMEIWAMGAIAPLSTSSTELAISLLQHVL
ncbi:hypothetical protein BTVI_148497 [Pitangus sulphuratus]|nr:hypothetical protein BTVI_148497 [Pitangus sulphuratus]